MKTTLQLLVAVAIALILIMAVHKIVGPEIFPEPTPKGLFSMEVAVFVILLVGFIVTEARRLLDSDKPYEPRFRNVLFLLVALLGSGGVFLVLVFVLDQLGKSKG